VAENESLKEHRDILLLQLTQAATDSINSEEIINSLKDEVRVMARVMVRVRVRVRVKPYEYTSLP
jgi:hypothetical protein